MEEILDMLYHSTFQEIALLCLDNREDQLNKRMIGSQAIKITQFTLNTKREI